MPWAKQPFNLLPPSSGAPLPETCSVKLHQHGDHAAITEDTAIAVLNMSSLLQHATQQQLRRDCVAVLRAAPLFFSSLDADPTTSSPVAMPHSLNALASLFPSDVIDGVLSAATLVGAGYQAAAEPPSHWQVGSLVTAKCPTTKTFRVAKVLQVNERIVQVQFIMPDRSLVCASYPGKMLRAVGSTNSKAAPSQSTAQRDGAIAHVAGKVSAAPPSHGNSHDDDILSLCSLALLPSVFQARNFASLFKGLLGAFKKPDREYCAVNALSALTSDAAFVAHMSTADASWISALAPVADVLNRTRDACATSCHHVTLSAVVSIFDSLLRSAASADQRRSFIDVMLRAKVVHALFRFCQGRDAPNAARDTAASVVLSCAGVTPSLIAMSWLRRSFREPRRSSSDLLMSILVLWTAHHENSDDDFSEERCVLSVERYNLIASSVKSFGFCSLEGLAKKLKVNFVLERGCDAGGLTVEWLHLLLDAALSDFSFFLPVLLPNGSPSGVVRVNHSAALASALPCAEVFRMIGCCLALCLQVISNLHPVAAISAIHTLVAVAPVRQQPALSRTLHPQVHHACPAHADRPAL